VTRGIILYGPPAAGKSTITTQPHKLDPVYTLFKRFKIGSGRSAGYRMTTAAKRRELHAADNVVWENEQYGNVYLIDRAGLQDASTTTQYPSRRSASLPPSPPSPPSGPRRATLTGSSSTCGAHGPKPASDSPVVHLRGCRTAQRLGPDTPASCRGPAGCHRRHLSERRRAQHPPPRNRRTWRARGRYPPALTLTH
jgi:hypothetical protein